ncbi:MAG: SPOR domain-containing protein [Formivibrio sp.]|nr:SPOR domain-containing protein [Formivibrio sp.]
MKKPRSGGGNKNGGSLLTGLVVGLIVGVAAAVCVAFYVNRGSSPFSGKAASTTAASAVPTQPVPSSAPEIMHPAVGKDDVTPAPIIASDNASAPPAQRASGVDRFDFYTMLPALNDKGSKESKPVEVKKSEASSPAKVEATKKAWLQIGSFQNEQEADNLKAKLALIGIEARIQTQDIPDKGLWHRVRVGPFNQTADIDKARAQLHGNGIESTVVKGD